jgi:hypothetical protein
MAAVCAAAIEGQADQWEVAERSLASGGGSLANDCLNRLVRDLLERALGWHDDHPGQQPQVRKQQVAGMTECGKASSPTADPDPGDPPPDSGTPSDTGASPEPSEPDGQSTAGSGG